MHFTVLVIDRVIIWRHCLCMCACMDIFDMTLFSVSVAAANARLLFSFTNSNKTLMKPLATAYCFSFHECTAEICCKVISKSVSK